MASGNILYVPTLFVVTDSNIYHYYVSQSNGLDTNDGKSPTTAFQTVERLLRELKGHWAQDIFCHFGPGGYSVNDFVDGIPYFQTSNLGALYFWGDGCGGTEGDGFTVIDTGTAAGGSTQTVIQTAGMGGDFAGYTIEFTSGALAGERRIIWSSTATAVTVGKGFSGVPGIGDAFRVVAPDVAFLFDVPPDAYKYSGVTLGVPGVNTGANCNVYSQTPTSTPLICWINVEFNDSALDETMLTFPGAHQFYGVVSECAGYTTLLFNGALCAGSTQMFGSYVGYDHTTPVKLQALIDVVGSAGGIPQWEGWGFGKHGVGYETEIVQFGAAYLLGCVFCGLGVDTSTSWLGGVRSIETSYFFGGFCYSTIPTTANRFEGIGAGSAALRVWGSSSLSQLSSSVITGAGYGVITDANGYIDLSGCTVNGSVMSVDAVAGGTVRINASTVLAGAGNARVSTSNCLRTDTGAAVAGTQLAAFFSGAGIGITNGFATVIRV